MKLLLLLLILVIGFLILYGCVHLYREMMLSEDEEHQERRDATRSLREARDDFRYEQDQARRTADLDKKGKKK